ncbi:MAG: diguanylate cyclase [Desulfovibrio sp.]|nr:MAG: diguanylate cyclase [Desulfovibrio sp.]
MADSTSICSFQRRIRCYAVTPDEELFEVLEDVWPEENAVWIQFPSTAEALEVLFTEPPDLLLVDDRLEGMKGADVVSLVKSENVYRQLPVVYCLAPELLDQVSWSKVEADEFLLLPVDAREARSRLSLTLCRVSRSLDANPLTRLPGNTTIIQRIQDLIDAKEEFGLAYVDLDHFKSFNDKYGFSRGDEVLLMSARILVNTVRGIKARYSFVGHVGGDDFVFILPLDIVEQGCAQVVERFDAIVPSFYDPEDQARGKIVSKDRQGKTREFPLMAVSIAVVANREAKLEHFGQASEIAMALKKKAKENPKSCYVLDRRHG